jgi:hypothetical protein
MAVNIPAGGPPPPLDLMKTNFVEFCKRYPKADTYGERSTQPYFDPRLDGVMSAMSRGAEQALTPDALPDGATTDAIVMRVDAYKAPAFTSLDPRIKTTSAALPKEMKSFSLKCFDLKTPIGIGTSTVESMALMNPWDIEDLPTFSGVINPGATTPKLGDIVEVKYALGSFRTGQYIKGLEINILPLLQQGAAKDSLVDQFAGSGKKYQTDGATFNTDLIKPSDVSFKDLEHLKPSFREKMKRVIDTLAAGGTTATGETIPKYSTRIIFSWRNMNVQLAALQRGDSKTLWSNHNHVDSQGKPAGNAVDIVWRKHGYDHSADNIAFMRRLGALAEAEGLTWGGKPSWAGSSINKAKHAWRKTPVDGGAVIGFDPLHVEGPADPNSMARATAATGVDISKLITELKKAPAKGMASALQVVDPTLA